jgi:AraC-like DNA-binding protein
MPRATLARAASPPATTQRDGVLVRIAIAFTAWAERWFPDAFVFVAIAVVIVALASWINGASPRAAVENAILPLLPHGKARIGKVAEDLGVSSRTLSRRLEAEGVTFAQVFDEMRADLAEGYLSDRSLSITHIAWLLGFQEASAFTHAYKRWTGKPPTDRRRSGARRPPTEAAFT